MSAPLIDWSFFIYPINIPNIDPFNGRNNSNSEKLNSIILSREEECLSILLGYTLYKELITEPLTARMLQLKYGAEYTDENGILQKWRGLINGKVSLIAYYIYYYYQQSDATRFTGIGTIIPTSQIGKSVSPGDSMIYAWNLFSDSVKQMSIFLRTSKNIDLTYKFPDFTDCQSIFVNNIFRKINVFGL